MLYQVSLVQGTINGCSDFIAQSILVHINHCTYHPFYSPKFSKIYRCWIVWGKNIRVVIIPSFLAISFLGQSKYPRLKSQLEFENLTHPSLVTWLAAADGASILEQDQIITLPWGFTIALTDLALSMAVNTLVTGLIVFKILKVFLEVKATSAKRTLGSLSSNAGGTKLQHIIFIIIESGMALFAIQLVRVVFTSLWAVQQTNTPADLLVQVALSFVYAIHEMLNVIMRSVHLYFFCSADNIFI